MSDYLTSALIDPDRGYPAQYRTPDTVWVDCGDGFSRAVAFEPGFNDPESRRYGVHGMQLRFLLRGPAGVTQFLMFTDWIPGQKSDGRTAGLFPMGADVGYHAPIPQYDGQEPMREACEILGGSCFYDGSGLAADALTTRFVTEGEPAVWRELRARHDDLLTEEAP